MAITNKESRVADLNHAMRRCKRINKLVVLIDWHLLNQLLIEAQRK
jgi:hypothetical protein